MIGVYLSGTGNTRHCIEKLTDLLDESAQVVPLEDDKVAALIARHDFIILAYPTQFSNAPIMVRDFIKQNPALWRGKTVFCVVTMGLFSGDGAGCSARLLKRYGAHVVGGLHILMPDSVCDIKSLKRPIEKNREIVKAADRKIEETATEIKRGKYPKDGLNFCNHIAGFFGQRLWFFRKTHRYSKGPTIDSKCVGCGLCIRLCPMKNIVLSGGKAYANNQCTMCYRCISICPQKAITLLGKEVIEQCRYERYASTQSAMEKANQE